MKKGLILALCGSFVAADPSRFLMQSGTIKADEPSFVEEADDENRPVSSAKAFKAAMDKLRADRDMFAKESAEYEQKAVRERREANAFVH